MNFGPVFDPVLSRIICQGARIFGSSVVVVVVAMVMVVVVSMLASA